MFMAKCHPRTRERVKGNTAFPFTIPAAPQRNRCFALRSPPAPLPAVGLTRVTRPIPGARPSGQRAALFKIVPDDFVLSRQTSVRHPWRPALVIGSSSHRFRRGLNPLAVCSTPEGYQDVAVVVMRENAPAMAKKVEDVHSIYDLPPCFGEGTNHLLRIRHPVAAVQANIRLVLVLDHHGIGIF